MRMETGDSSTVSNSRVVAGQQYLGEAVYALRLRPSHCDEPLTELGLLD